MEMKNIREAAEYLSMSERAIRDHLDRIKDLRPDDRGKYGRRLFRVETLDQFNRRRRRQGQTKRYAQSPPPPAPAGDEHAATGGD